MKKPILMIVVLCLLLLMIVIVALIAILNSNQYYSKKLTEAIIEKDLVAAQQIINEKPDCVNAFPTMLPRWFYVMMDTYCPTYPLNTACAIGDIDVIKLLIENGADVNCNDGETPLSLTYCLKPYNWYAISLLLIESGASLNYITQSSGEKNAILYDIVQVRRGSTLPGYVPENKEEVIKAFHYAIENCDHSNIDWMRVMMHSVCGDRIEIVDFLLNMSYCNVNDTSLVMTPLMYAARDSTPEMVQLLLEYGADKSIKSSDGKTAYDYAVQSNNEEIIAILTQH